MRRALPLVLFAAAFAWQGCRQLAGIEDLEPADASLRDGRAPEASARDRRIADVAGDGGAVDAYDICGCTGCEELAGGLNAPLSLAVVGGDVYVLSYGPEDGTGSLDRVPTAGGKKQTVLGGLTRPFSLTSDGKSLYFQAADAAGKGTLVRWPLGGGTPRTLAIGLGVLEGVVTSTSLNLPTTNDIVVTPGGVYFVGFTSGTGFPAPGGILSVPLDGGTVTTVATEWPHDGGSTYEGGSAFELATWNMVSDGVAIYASNISSQVGLFKVALGAGSEDVLVDDLDQPIALTLAGRDVVFCDNAPNLITGSLQTVPEDGGAPTILGKEGAAWAMVTDPTGKVVYFIDPGNIDAPPTIRTFDLPSGKGRLVVPATALPSAIAVDDENVYWTDSFCGTLMKFAR